MLHKMHAMVPRIDASIDRRRAEEGEHAVFWFVDARWLNLFRFELSCAL